MSDLPFYATPQVIEQFLAGATPEISREEFEKSREWWSSTRAERMAVARAEREALRVAAMPRRQHLRLRARILRVLRGGS